MAIAVILIWIFCGIMASMVARNKGRSGCAWFLLGILFGPFSFAVALLGDKEKPPEEGSGGTRKCPFCAEMIKAEAIKCKYCGSAIEPIKPDPPPEYKCRKCDYVFDGECGPEGWYCHHCNITNWPEAHG